MSAREVIARAILSNNVRPHMSARDDATAILSALDAAGLAVVPKEATKEMRDAVTRHHPYTHWGQVWAVMLAAAKEGGA